MNAIAAVFIALTLASVGFGADPPSVEIAATGISVPFFDDAGHLTHKMTAKRGTAAGDEQNLEEVEVIYFAAGKKDVVTHRMQAKTAQWRSDTEILSGSSAVSLDAEGTKITGEQFQFALATSVLHIERDFRLANPDLYMTSDRAVVKLAIERKGERMTVRDVESCEAIGNLHIVVTSRDRRRFPFDEAFSANAIYDGANNMITMPSDVRMIRNGQAATSRSAEFKLPPRMAPAKSRPPISAKGRP